MDQQGYVISQIDKGIASIEFFHPAHNSLPSNLLNDLVHAIKDADHYDEVRVILLSSGGERTFCAGASFTELSAIDNEEDGNVFFHGFAKVINAIRTCSKLVVGRIHGKTIGGGVGIAAACDYAIANKYASIKLSELSIGIGPFVIGPAVERKIGLSAFSQLSINATEWQTAQWAKEKGLYAESFETTEQMDAYIAHFLEKLTSYSLTAMKNLKEMLWEGTDHWDELLAERAETSGLLVLTDEAKKAINGFLKA